MSMRDKPQHDTEDPRLPDELAERLSSLHDQRLFIPPDMDRAILEQARGHFGVDVGVPRATHHRLWLRLAIPTAAAAMIALGVWTVWHDTNTPTGNLQVIKVAFTGDADDNGEINILDAFAMARVIDAEQPVPAEWDINHDGRVDRADVSIVASMAVSLANAHNESRDSDATGGHRGIKGASS